MKVFLATDHTGLELKEKLKVFLKEKGYDPVDCGAYEYDKDDDYPDFIAKAAEGVSKDPDNARGIIFGGSGQGEAMVANKFRGVRCAVFYTPALPVSDADITGRKSEDPYEMIKLTRDHNNANMLSFGFRFLQEEDVLKASEIFLTAPFTGAERHKRRIDKIKKIENNF
jgi:ribose 5-phosphate isomerase B